MIDKRKQVHKKNQSAAQEISKQSYHVPVLLQEAIDGLNIQPEGTYVDCTFGGGGHSGEILKRLQAGGKLFVFDQDADVKAHVPDDERIVFIAHNFRHLQRFLRLHKTMAVDGILADLGVSSHQFDEAERGFSIRFDAALDMRMDKRQSLTAEIILNSYGETELHKLFEQYGELSNARTLARTIVQTRQLTPLKTINGFKQAISQVVKGNPNRYFAQVFQALRIEVNDEMGALRELLEQIPGLLNPGGRAAIITFHSLEDRMVKNFFKRGTFSDEDQSDLFGQQTVIKTLIPITKKPILPAEEETSRNSRSRSAMLRIAEKISTGPAKGK